MISLPAPGKLNLFLHVVGRRANGYHNLQSVIQFFDYCDMLHFQPRHDEQIILHTNLNIPLTDNLIFKAAKLLQHTSQLSQGVEITLEKKLPIGAGIGGGSSNAATTLVALNHLWQLHLSIPALCELGMTLGADVPMFIFGQSAWVEGIGEILYPIKLPEPWYILLVPAIAIATPDIFAATELTRNTPILNDRTTIPKHSHNDLADVVLPRYPLVRETFEWLNQFAQARMTGSGSGVFAAVESQQKAEQIAAHAPKNLLGIVAKGLNQSPLYTQLQNL